MEGCHLGDFLPAAAPYYVEAASVQPLVG